MAISGDGRTAIIRSIALSSDLASDRTIGPARTVGRYAELADEGRLAIGGTPAALRRGPELESWEPNGNYTPEAEFGNAPMMINCL